MERNPLQDDYVRFPKSKRGGTAIAAHIARRAALGQYDLTSDEIFWRDIQPYLLSKGYRLRPRYTPGWVAPWIGTDIYPFAFEEHRVSFLPNVIDARRESDDALVAIKWIPAEKHTRHEVDVLSVLSSDELRLDPRNHCNLLLETLSHPEDPNGILLVTPWRYDLNFIPIERVNELVDMMLQLFEGLAFMHKHNVAHRDCTGWNIMQDSSSAFPGLRCHPWYYDMSEDMQTSYIPLPRCMCKFRYYFIDFGVSSRHEGPGPHLVTGTICRDDTAPELSDTMPYDPFKLDIYLLGNHFLQQYANKYSNLAFLHPMLLRMTRRDPAIRPSASEALQMLTEAAFRPSGISFRWRLRKRDEGWLPSLFFDGRALWFEARLQFRQLFFGTNELSFGRPADL
ncbi:hypothetical protein AURDEDRAFT_71855 [Auricularia subglabra TFB-10046 SS5]|nr:hypothetical protein AURDEDRAFT_71855 [Auricularia subglabra TFB-10046 SS5]